jgi:glycosyltransferase involved in cell wall biosynthesis
MSPTETGSSVSKRIAVVASLTLSLTNFRFQLLKAFVDAGHRVTAYAPEFDAEVASRLAGIGVELVLIPMSRTGTNPFRDARTLWSLYQHFTKSKPDLVMPYTMKPIIYGLAAARLAGVEERYALFTGMGHVFANERLRGMDWLVRQISVHLYRVALKSAKGIFIYNSADENDVKSFRLVGPGTAMIRVSGSGVDLQTFPVAPLAKGPVTFLMVSRLLRDKGVFEFVEAAKILRSRHKNSRFQLLGPLEPHATSITMDDIRRFEAEGGVEYLGETRDVRPYLANCSVFVLPTAYREGIPRSILEALATGRPIITTDAPGCRETVEPEVNGLLVPPRSSKDLAAAMERFILEPKLIAAMGEKSRSLAASRFDVNAINRKLLSHMGLV